VETSEENVIELERGYHLKPKVQSTGKEDAELWLDPENGTVYLFEWKPYLLIGDREFILRLFDKKIKATKITPEIYMAEFQFENYVGKSFIEIYENGQRTLKKPIEVLSTKVREIMKRKGQNIVDAHKKFYNALFEDILRVSSSLPFSLSAPTAFAAGEGEEPVNELFAYHYLRSNKERIKEAFKTVIKNAKRKLIIEEEWIEPYELDEITPDTIVSMIQNPQYLAPAGEGVSVAQHLNGFAPTKVFAFRKYENFDTPENRFAKYFLDMLIVWAERVIESFRETKGTNMNSILELYGELEFLRADPIWEEVGEMTVFPYTSQTLLKGDGYRDLLELYREFTAYVPFFERLWTAIENKDIATLYEYWAFFRLVKELSTILGEPRFHIGVDVSGILSEGLNSYVSFGKAWRLYYNRKFRSKSYSVPVKPDFALLKNKKIVGVFDAKFKVEIPPIEEFADMDKDMERTPDLQTWAKIEDIYKMHTYRDALKCRFAIAIYLGTQTKFFDVNNGKIENISLDEILTGQIAGVGYLSFVPEVKK
jgi:hypothetical protein